MLFWADSQTNRQLYQEACAATAAAIDALPFDYREIGEERYARTWSLRSGYEGYCSFREAFAAMGPADPEYSSSYYRVAQIQENLASYALRLVQVTMAQGSSRFRMNQSDYVEILLTPEERDAYQRMMQPLYEQYCAAYMELVCQIQNG